MKIKLGQISYSILRVYRPSSGDMMIFIRTLQYILHYCSAISHVLFLCRDFNIDYPLLNVNGKRLLCEFFLSYSLSLG